ncbi:hypothetical protein [Pleionea sp. CnH1-48]|uniref:hypothetical protein n=1 Tax=Pleionea sp. CnH1-48 TaxID=2954494 RepID=UPI0020978705|nr:hypothetical protein [Pleionea sp. CnH1-48]MCO7223766.1 hypothetical protein [Pleionea sp. CnH1-48]
MKFIVALIYIVLLSGCATADFNYRAQSVRISEPPLRSVNIAYVGDPMLKQGKYKEHDSLYIQSLVEVSWGYDLNPGYYLKQGEDDNSETYLPSGGEDGGSVVKAALADRWKAIMAYKDKDELCIITIFNALSCIKTNQFVRKKKPIVWDDSFQRTLIYSGKVGNKLNISYREFYGSAARPAFNNNVEYDIGESSMIGYKGARLKIVEATNEYIKYQVISNFNEAKL